MTAVHIQAGFPVNEKQDQFKIDVWTAVEEAPSDDYSERMMVFVTALRELANDIEKNHGP